MDFIGNITREICIRQTWFWGMIILIIVPFELLLYKNRVREPVNFWQDMMYTPVRYVKYAINAFRRSPLPTE